MTISEQIATKLNSLGIATYSNDTSSDILLDALQDREYSLGIYTKASRPGDDKNGIRIVGIQIIARGSENPIATQGFASQVFNALNAYRRQPFVTGENYIISCLTKNGDPVGLGCSENGFYDYSMTFEVIYS